jgi:hypothetical protein
MDVEEMDARSRYVAERPAIYVARLYPSAIACSSHEPWTFLWLAT